MDGAVKRLDKVAQRFLPDRPHHLSVSSSRRFPDPQGFWYDGLSSRLQYMTYLSDADRGFLLTRPSYDIRDDAEVKASLGNSLNANQKDGSSKKPVNKMSLKDYQTKKKPSSLSPMADDAPLKSEGRIGGPAEVPRDGHREGKHDGKSSSRAHGQDAKENRSMAQTNGDGARSSQAKAAPPRTDPSAVAESRKRTAATDAGPRSPKRTKPNDKSNTPRGDSINVARPETPRKYDFEDGRAGRASAESRATKTVAPASAVNGRASLGVDARRDLSPSPKPVIRVNGARVAESYDGSPKPSVPPLLSPLRLPLDDDGEARASQKKSAADTPPDSRKLGHSRGSSIPSAAPRKRSPFRIPPLLSPTLPPIVESELARLKRTPPKDDTSQRSSQTSESPSSARKSKAYQEGIEEEEERRPARPRLIVTLKYKRKNVLRVQRLLALPPSGKRKERSVSAEVTPPPPLKRPAQVAASAAGSSSSSSKREAASWTKPARPTTPLKNSSTAMSRVASSNSQAHTPGDTAVNTPGAADKRAVTSNGNEHSEAARAATLRQRYDDYTQLGTRLKHSRDDLIRARARAEGGGGPAAATSLPPAEEKKVAALSLEMILAYMMGFKALNQERQLGRKPPKYALWEDLVPHFNELRHRTRQMPVLLSVCLQLNAVCLEELNQCYLAHEPSAVGAKLWKNSKRLRDVWTEAHDRAAAVRDESLRAGGLGPWTPIDVAAATALRVVRRWADVEKVDWRAEISLSVANGA